MLIYALVDCFLTREGCMTIEALLQWPATVSKYDFIIVIVTVIIIITAIIIIKNNIITMVLRDG